MALSALAIAAALGVYVFRCWAFPFAPCWWCRGDGIRGGTFCRRCDGTGRRVRLGRRAFDRARAEYRRGTDHRPNNR
ncbi:hypothetical protein GCM10027447_16790 [Glycomyces halotolerans]